MSELFVAETTGVEGFSRNFVLKRLRRELARNKEAIAQFIDEARMQASLVHSNVVPVFDFGVVNGEYFMTQEYIVGPRIWGGSSAGTSNARAWACPSRSPSTSPTRRRSRSAYAHENPRQKWRAHGHRPPRRLAGQRHGFARRRG